MGKILIVDDEEHIRMLYKETLSRDGHQVITAASGKEALACLEKSEIDLVILDIELEGENGINVLKSIKETKADLPIILNTAYSIYKSDFKTWMAEDYIVKSSDIQPLRDKINQLVTV